MLRRKQNTGKKLAAGAALGGIAGYLAGLLTAPKSGAQTRQDLGVKAGGVKSEAENQLQSVADELAQALKSAKTKTATGGAKARADLNEAVIKAKDAQNKASEVLKAVRAGEAANPELNRAVKQGRQALRNLSKYLKS
ncbi:MAG TPA: YtxH domain-containing protein [Candidatus Saccharimonadales bacterium]|nr:YtxH domain-containing protein [Candidatus Saccharimonadales bacterium]